MSDSSPMMQQYSQIKAQHRDAILFFRLGDFYEMFHADAKEASRILSLTLTQRNGVPMCGIPYHAASSYISRLLKAGKKVAICEQVQLPERGRGIAERQVVEVLTPGTVTDGNMLDGDRNNFLLALGARRSRSRDQYEIALLALDISTGEFLASSFTAADAASVIGRELYRFSPRELVIQESFLDEEPLFAARLRDNADLTLNRYPDWFFDTSSAALQLKELLGVNNLKAFGLNDDSFELYPLPALLDYVKETIRQPLAHLKGIEVYRENDGLGIDENSQKNLELVANLQDGTRKFSLLDTIDRTQTPMGSRLLRARLLKPLTRIEEIEARLSQITALYRDQMLLSRLRGKLSEVRDLDRLAARIGLDKAHGKEVQSLGFSILISIELLDLLEDSRLLGLYDQDKASHMRALGKRIVDTLCENPSVVLHEGNLIRGGFDPDLDRLRMLQQESRTVLESYLEKEREASGISSLRVKHNKIIGYHYEVTKSQLSKVPDHFIRRQSLVNVERFSTEELARVEEELNSAAEMLVELERSLFLKLRDQLKEEIPAILDLGRAIATLDVAAGLAQLATEKAWVEPRLTEEPRLKILRARHPVVEAHQASGAFVPNDLCLSALSGEEEPSVALITGPNMAGKSTYLRQNALVVLLAQMGSYVPAEEAQVGICDRIFCRVGASDNLAKGESTFLVEMNETAVILRQASSRSLVIMDEVGRGTSTQDGLAIARAVLEYLVCKIRCRTLFATHYHELTQLELERMANFTLRVKNDGKSLVFLKEVIPGSAPSSYGIHVAGLAGVPKEVIDRAFELLHSRGEEEGGRPGEALEERLEPGKAGDRGRPSQSGQRNLFSTEDLLVSAIGSLDPNGLTPLEALSKLFELKEILARDQD